MIYLNQFKQLSDNAVASLYNLVKDLVNKNTTNILEVGTYAGQVTVQLCAAAGEKSSSVSVISIDDNNDTFSPSAEESLKENLENPIRGAPGVPDPDACPDGKILGKHF